jgi:chromosome partitioning protein
MSDYSNTKIISVVNQKGGVGKTTTAANLGTALAAIHKKVLIIDLDPQGNASTGFGISQKERLNTLYEVLLGEVDINNTTIKTEIPHLSIASSNVNLSAAEIELIDFKERDLILKKALKSLDEYFDYIIIDCPPSLGILTLNGLVASDSVLIPLQCEFYALEGLSHLLKTIELVKNDLNPELDIEGIVLTMYDKRNKLTEQVENDVRGCLADAVFDTIIPRNVRVSEAPSHGKPAIIYDHKCSGSQAYMVLAKELIKREKNTNKQLVA